LTLTQVGLMTPVTLSATIAVASTVRLTASVDRTFTDVTPGGCASATLAVTSSAPM